MYNSGFIALQLNRGRDARELIAQGDILDLGCDCAILAVLQDKGQKVIA